ncbi:hypothetical protein Cch01nite_00550 [Cellulomonas chitinilytica]|uniref:General stress protein 17M-like domain-containing protein n=1 Tax=Cellulomonas chitinilytica TaxID=398759 RepID=A0A919NXC0_9CELL|nr:general stress protein [Cellulomonas chitinilytica]GIG19331.1 hypothetical protein Cch01nite_00550 [Cellulomonas chitinilytica]
MSFSGQPRPPRTPTPPQGETVAAYATYLEAQRAVDHLADSAFPVQLVTIVGTDLKMVERVTGRLSYPRVAMGGFVSGAWFGLFVGLLLSLFTAPGSRSPFLPAILIGGAFGLLFSVVPYSFTRGRRDFTSSSQIVASSYAVLCRTEQAHKARELLREIGGVQSGVVRPPAPVVPSGPPSDATVAYPPPAGPSAPPAHPTGSPSVPPVGPPGPPPGPGSTSPGPPSGPPPA